MPPLIAADPLRLIAEWGAPVSIRHQQDLHREDAIVWGGQPPNADRFRETPRLPAIARFGLEGFAVILRAVVPDMDDELTFRCLRLVQFVIFD